MTTEQLKSKLSTTVKIDTNLKQKLQSIRTKLSEQLKQNGILLDHQNSDIFHNIMKANNTSISAFSEDSPMHLLWQQQLSALNRKSSSGIRWHLTLIIWCIALYSKSPATYDMIKSSKFLILPHKNTIKD